jgi:hypothetical protein
MVLPVCSKENIHNHNQLFPKNKIQKFIPKKKYHTPLGNITSNFSLQQDVQG